VGSKQFPHAHIMELTAQNVMAWRLQFTRCDLCPFQRRRKVGFAGDINADIILWGEAPGADEASYRAGQQLYGEPFVGRAGWALKEHILLEAGPKFAVREGKGHRLTCFVGNTIMCNPPKNKITGTLARKARAACTPSGQLLLAALIRKKRRTLVPMGDVALEATKGVTGIGKHRGRVNVFNAPTIMFEHEQLKILLRGVKPPTEWKGHKNAEGKKVLGHEGIVRLLLAWNRRMMKPRKLPKVKRTKQETP